MLILNFVEALFSEIKYLMSAYGILETLQSYYNCNVFTGRMHDSLWSSPMCIVFLNMCVR